MDSRTLAHMGSGIGLALLVFRKKRKSKLYDFFTGLFLFAPPLVYFWYPMSELSRSEKGLVGLYLLFLILVVILFIKALFSKRTANNKVDLRLK